MRWIGLMSGTSVDGIDATMLTITGAGARRKWKVEGFVCVPWQEADREAILGVCRPDAPVQMVTALNSYLGEAFADAAKQVAASVGVALSDVDAIASHGQTIWHQPSPLRVGVGSARGTLQIGEPSVIAARTGCWVVADFRQADMALGGQGAPLVPFADWALFWSPKETRAVQNIGGIGNVTLLPAQGALRDVVAFDTGPGNILLDALACRVTQGASKMDIGGRLAADGTVCRPLADALLEHPYFGRRPPKTTGREEFGAAFTETFLTAAHRHGCAERNWLATATWFTAETICRAYRDFLPLSEIKRVLVGGGGTSNPVLLGFLKTMLAPITLCSHSDFGLADEAKEAVAFALLGYETIHGRPSNVPAATGAEAAAILGKIVPPPQGGGKLRFRLDKRAVRPL